MASRAEVLGAPGEVRYTRIEEKIRHLKRSNIDQETKEILEILDQGNIIYPARGPSIMKWLVRKIDDLYQEPSYAELVQTLHSSYKASAPSKEEHLGFLVWYQLRYGATDLLEAKRRIHVTSDSIAREVIAKLKIYTPLDQELCAHFLDRYIPECYIDKEWNSHFVGVLTFLIKEGADPFDPLGYTRSAFSMFLDKFSPCLSNSLMPSVTTFLEEAFKKWEVSEAKESILHEIIKNLPMEIKRGDSIHLSSLKELIVRNCLDIIKTNPHLCDYEDREGKTPLHKLMEAILKDDLWKRMPGLVAETDKLWDLMSGLITKKNVNIKDKDKVTPYTWILWWQNFVTDRQTFDAQEKQTLAKKIEDVKKQFQEKRASEKKALQGLKNLKTTSPYRRIEEKIDNLTKLNVEREAKEILQIIEEGEIIYPTQGPSIMKKLVGKTDELYLEPSFAKLIKALHPSYEASALAKEEYLTGMVWWKLRGGATDWSESKGKIWITSKSIARDVMAKLKIYTPLERWLRTRNLKNYVGNCDIDKEWNSDFVGLLTFLIREGADPFHPLTSGSKPPPVTAFKEFLENFSPHLSDSLMPSVSDFLEEAFKKWETSKTKESILYDVIKNLPSDIVKGESSHLSTIKVLIVRNCLEIIKTNPNLCDHEDIEGKTPLHKLMENILIDGFWKGMPKLVAGTDTLWDLMSGLITNKNVNHKDKDKVTPYTWILWWQNFVTDCQTFDAQEKQTLAKKVEDVKKQFQEKGASEEDALQGLKNLKTTSKTTGGKTSGLKGDSESTSQSHQKSKVDSEQPSETQQGSKGASELASQSQEKSKLDVKQPSQTQKKSTGDSELASQSQQESKVESNLPSETQLKSSGESELPLQSRQEMTGEPASPTEENPKTSLKEQVPITPETKMEFKVPKMPMLRKLPKSPVRNPGIPITADLRQCDFKAIEIVKVLGHGGFGSISLCKKGIKQFVLKEMLRGNNPNEQKLFLKEAFLLQKTKHKNIVEFDSIVQKSDEFGSTLALLMEYVVFDFRVFGDDECQISSLADMMELLDQNNFAQYEHLNNFVASDAAHGLDYLHRNGIVHRDLKPGNILVSNQHYNELDEDAVEKHWNSRPIVAKLADFGEGRAELLHTATLVASHTSNLARGTVVFSAPEIICENLRKASFEDLKHMDVWSFGMVLFALVNPDLKHPYQLDFKGSLKSAEKTLRDLMEKKQLPSCSEKYDKQRKTVWSNIFLVHKLCTQFFNRPSIEYVADLLKEMVKIKRNSVAKSSSEKVEERNLILSINVQPARQSLVEEVHDNPEEYYQMFSKPRGRVVILNNEIFEAAENVSRLPERRYGSYQDVENLRNIFQDLHFDVVEWIDCTASEIRKNIKEEQESQFHRNADAFIFIAMSHGETGRLTGKDGKSVYIEKEIVSAFDGQQCPLLLGKPKLFFIQACQGDQRTQGETVPDATSLVQRNVDDGPVHGKADILRFYSTTEGQSNSVSAKLWQF